MTKMVTALIGWKKGLATMAQTYAVEVTDASVWFGRLGSGGAHWQPDYLAMAMAANLDIGPQTNLGRRIARMGPTGAGAALGGAMGGKILNKFNEEIRDNGVAYEAHGRSALEHKSNIEVPVSDFASAKMVKKLPWNAPPALKGVGGPYAEVKLDGDTWFLVEVPGGPSLENFLLAVGQPISEPTK